MSDPTTVNPNDASGSTDIAKQLYEQNVQLAIHNKTLGVLSKLYEISMATLDVKDVCQKIVDTLSDELSISFSMLSLVLPDEKHFYPVAITNSEGIAKSLELIGKPLQELCLEINDPQNLIAQSIHQNKRQITGNVLDIVTPFVSQEIADDIENLTGIKTLIIYPIALGTKSVGSLTVGLTKPADDLSRAEKQTLEEVINLIAIAIDRAQLHESVRQANEALQKLDMLKDEFLSMASHELKSPMNAVKNYLWMALHKGKEHPEKLDEYLTIAYESIQRLIVLVNDLLDVSRIESGRVSLELKPIPLSKVIKETIEIYDPQAKAKNLELINHVGLLETELYVLADDMKIRDVLNNLVSNAIKYTPQGSVTIGVEQRSTVIRILVSDTGMGISEEDQEKLFQKFSRVGTSFKQMATIEGTGLGLYIGKQFAEMMNGSIGMSSQVGKGSTFWFELPKAEAPSSST
ncbi:GAF domain-containing sensor histidine kinase [Candidatus Woesebacteria bacterium]|nr:GAF domain-containing sensor histidine kinase [Candidatus Woesebacteria bacterium]